jgi:PST family polysaccharide transporter
MALQSVGLQVLSVVTTAILARLLAPEDFGIIAITTVLVGFFSLVNAYGINASVIRRPDLDDTIVSTYFWLAVMLGTTATLVLMALSGLLASSFGQASTAPFVAAMAPVLLFNLVRSVPLAILSRRLRFGPVAGVAVIDFVVYAGIAIALAATTDIGAWSVIIGRVLGAAASLIAAFAFSRWRPLATFRWSAVIQDITFNLGVLANAVIGFLARNIDYWIVGRLGVRALGVYYIAYVLPNVLKRRLALAGTEVMFPILSRITDERERFGRAFLDATRFITIAGFPMMFGLAAVADAVVRLLFGSAYLDAIEPMSILAVASGVSILFATAYPVFLADGVPLRGTPPPVLRILVTGAGMVIALEVGTIVAVSWAVFAGTMAGVILAEFLVVRRLDLRLRDVVIAVAPATVCSLVMIAVVLGAKRILGEAALTWPGLVAVVAAGAAAYLASGMLMFRRAFRRFLKNLRTAILPSRRREDGETDAAELSAGIGDGA